MTGKGTLEQVILAAVIKHAKREKGRERRYDAALFFMGCVYDDLKRRKMYQQAQVVYGLRAQVERAHSVAVVAAQYGLDAAQVTSGPVPDHTPASNTGVTPQQLSVLEAYVGNE